MKLYVKGQLAVAGQEVETFRGEKAELIGWTEPRHSGSTGRVFIRSAEGWEGEYYPGVINAKFEEDDYEEKSINSDS